MGAERTTSIPTGTVTFLFTDIEGSTPLWDAHPDEMGIALPRHDSILRSAIDRHDGYIFSTAGDGLAAAFATAADAIAAAIDAQRLLHDEAWPDPIRLHVRMGLNTGETDERDGDYFGPPVNRAARLMGVANGGQIVLSAATAHLVRDIASLTLLDLGSARLKGFADPVQVFGVSARGLDWIDTPLVTAQSSAGNLPRPNTEYVGDLADLQRRVAVLPDTRLVTLTGSGGVGKTRAAVEVAWLAIDEYVDGAWIVELGPIADPDAVATAIASSLHVVPQPAMTTAESIVDWCLGRRMLLILDNCEHVLAPFVGLVSTITTSCETATVLATSREPLGIAGEIVIRIPSLSPDHGVELFIQRATAADASFASGAAERDTITSICDRLDGIPLAIELAASRSRSLTPDELLERLNDRFRLLRSAGRGGLERHQTLRATVSWSYQLLSDVDQTLFDRLTVFAGGFDLAAAEAICCGRGVAEIDIADVLGELVDKSMVGAERVDGATRYQLLETLRQFGEERLEERGDTEWLRTAHLAHYETIAGRLGAAWLGPEQLVADRRFDLEWDNIRAAHQWASTVEDLDRAVAISGHVSTHAWSRLRNEVAEWAEQARVLAEARGQHPVTVLNEVAYWTYIGGSVDRAIALAEQGLADTTDPSGAVRCRANLLYALMTAGRAAEVAPHLPALHDAARSRDIEPASRWLAAWARFQGLVGGPASASALEQLEEISAELDVPTYNAELRRMRGMFKLTGEEPDYDGAIADLHQAIEMIEKVSLRVGWAEANVAIAVVFGERPDRVTVVRRALAAAYDVRNWPAMEMTFELAANLLARAADREAADTMMGHLLLHPAGWGEGGVTFRASTLEMLAGGERSEERRAEGRTMERHEFVAYVLAHLDAIVAA